MMEKIAKMFDLLRREVSSVKADVSRLERIYPVVARGKDGVSPDPEEIISAVLERMPEPKDGVSPDLQAVAAEAAKLVPESKPGRDAVPLSIRDVADVVLANIEKPKDGVSPDLNAVAEQAAKLIPKPEDGVSPTPEAVAKTMPVPKQGKPGKDGVSVTDVQLNSNELFVFLDGRKKSAGKIKLPASTAPFRPGGDQGGGGGTTRTIPPFFSQVVVVTDASQLSGELLSTVLYVLDGVVDFTGTGSQIVVPTGGLNLAGHTFQVSGIKCEDDDYDLFIDSVGGSGGLLGSSYFVEVTGNNSRVYDLSDVTGDNTLEFQNVNYIDCSSLGELNGYRQILEIDTGRFGGKPELTLSGAMAGGCLIMTSLVRNLEDGGYSLFKAGAGLLMQSRFKTDINLDLPASASFFDFSAANFANSSTVQLDSCIVTRNGASDASDTNLTPNIVPSELVCAWDSNTGIGNTFVGGELTVTAEITTTITASGVFVDLAGTYSADDLQHFDQPVNGQLRHLGSSPIEYSVSGQLVLDSGSNNEVDLKIVIFRAATSTFVDGKTQRRVINNLQGGRDVGYFVLSDNIVLNFNDYVKLQVANVGGTANITAEIDSFFINKAR